MYSLRPTKQQPLNKKIYGFDIETYNNNKNFLCASIYHDEEHKWYFEDKQELIDFFKTKRFWGSYIAATNLTFDFFGTFFNTEEAQEFKTLFRGSELIFAETWIENKKMTRYPKKSRREMLTFIDTMNYARMSVEKIGKIVGVPKFDKPGFLGEKPQTDKEWNIMKEYNMQDSRVSKKFLEFLFDSFVMLGATPRKTIASTAMSLYKNQYLNGIYWRHYPSELKFIFDSYYGGRTEAFKRGVIKDYNYYDFNSLYPSVMLNSFPDPNSLRKNHKHTLTYIKEYDGVSDVTLEAPDIMYPLLPFRTKSKLIFGYGEFRGKYTHIELRKAIDLGYIIKKIHKTYYYTKNIYPFKGYVEDLYNLRMKYKKEKNPMQQVCKLLLNSLYGKFGQKFENKDNWIPFNHTPEELSKLEYFERIGDYMRIKKKFTEPSAFCIPIWATYVSAYGRLKLYDAICKSNPVYCDTDSIMTKKEIDTSDKLGDLKLEMNIKEGMIVKPKFYAVQDSKHQEYVKIKGLGVRLNMLEFFGFLVRPEARYKKFIKFKEAVRRGLIPNEIVDMTKCMSLEDDKRRWVGNFDMERLQDSEPLEIIDGLTEIQYKKEMNKAFNDYINKRNKERNMFINSDLFDKSSVGKDITYEEFLENEQDYKTF